jgi:hypothetical protein
MEIEHWDKTKTNLDIKNITLCAGSRYADGFVPDVFRYCGGVVRVRRCGPRLADPYLRARREVSLNSCDSSLPKNDAMYIGNLEERVKKLEDWQLKINEWAGNYPIL